MNSQTRARLALALGVLFLCGGTVWAVRAIKAKPPGPAPAVKELYDKQSALRKNKDLTREEKMKLFKELSEQEKNLTPEQKRQLDELRDDAMFKSMSERAERLFDLPEDQREEQLKKDMEEFRRGWGGRPRGDRPPSTNPERKGPPSTEQRGPRPDDGRDPNEEEQRMKSRLDKSTPEQRAKISAYFAMMRQQRQQQQQNGANAPPKK